MGRLDKLYKTDVPHRAKLVYIYLHDRMDKERKAWPGLNTIASHLSLSRSTVKRAVKDLEKAGLIGLVVFYLSSGFFVVFFTASFMELSRHMRLPSLWAGMGRAMNNVSAALITNGSVALLATGNSLAAIVIALVLFVAVSVAMAVYTARMNAVMEPKEPPASQKSDEERREAFIAKYGLTEREWDVFSQMISSDSSAQEIADCLFLSKRTVERHISALYEKTGAKSRITMYLLYRND